MHNIKAEAISPVHLHYDWEEDNAFVLTTSDQEIEVLKSNPNVVHVEEDPIRYPMHLRGGESVRPAHRKLFHDGDEIPYGVRMVQAPEVWALSFRGQGVKVCVMDTGIDASHEDFVRSRLTGFEGVGSLF